MGLFFRKRVRVGRGTWLNVSRSGVSVSERKGPVTVNSRGRVSIRLPGGFTWRSGR